MNRPVKVSVTFTLYPEDVAYILRMREMGEEMPSRPEAPHTDDLLTLWSGLTCGCGHSNAGAERFVADPDYSAFEDFCGKIEKLRKKILSAHSDLHVFTMATEG